MRRWLAVLLCVAAWTGAAGQDAFGVAPVYDNSGTRWGPTFTQYLTLALFDDLQAAGSGAVLLNPGGVYVPTDTSWLADYVDDKPAIRTLLAATLAPPVYANKSETRVTLTLTALVLDRSGQTRQQLKASTEIELRKTDLEGSFLDPLAGWKFGFTTGHRTFDKSPLGKAAQTLAQQVRDRLELGGSTAPAAIGSGSLCAAQVKVNYLSKHGASSQAYTLVVNGLDQSMNIESGTASFKAPEGPMLIQLSVADAPYKVAVQNLYQFSTTHRCAKTQYVIDLGKSGDAHDHWE